MNQASAHDTIITAYAALNITGAHILLPILLVTLLSSRPLRHPLLISLCVVSILQGISTSLILYVDGYHYPFPRHLCLVQAVLVWSSETATAAAGLMLVFHTYLTVRASVEENANHKPKRLALDPMYQVTMVLFPSVLFLFFILAGIATVVAEPAEVTLSRRILYCAVGHGGYSIFISVVAAAITSLTICVNVLLGISLWKVLSKYRWNLLLVDHEAPFDVRFALRVFFSGAYLLAACGFAVLAVVPTPTIITDIFTATISIFIFLMFGTRRAVWRCAMAQMTQQSMGNSGPLADAPNVKIIAGKGAVL